MPYAKVKNMKTGIETVESENRKPNVSIIEIAMHK